ncbi:uncharacterized protein [Miscanthus floridulus]|uniref:uncharacterized protein n=1 Tax=Miscanthus floridulus TaxID=154761 RepID=UPI003457BAF7
MANLEVVDCEGKGGGLAVLWRGGINVVFRSKSKNHVDLEVPEAGGAKWRFTGIYGEPQTELKYKTWKLMEWLREQDDDHLTWLCAGDFNEILFHHEKEGVPRSQSYMDRFKGALEGCELDDHGFSWDIFTWRNKHMKGEKHISERLDRAVANAGWRVMFPLIHVKNGDPYHSDHRPVVVLAEMVQRGRGEAAALNLKRIGYKKRGADR